MKMARHWLFDHIGQRVSVTFDDLSRTEGELTEIRASGCRVRFDGETKDRTVAEWRISKIHVDYHNCPECDERVPIPEVGERCINRECSYITSDPTP